MWVPALLALLLCAVCFSLCSHVPLYHFVDQNLTWSEAQQFCRQHYSDLATVVTFQDNLRLPRPPGYSAPVWIGLYDDPTDLSCWRSVASPTLVVFENWESAEFEPRYVHQGEQYGALRSTGWFTAFRSDLRPALCFSAGNPKVYHFPSGPMSRLDALTECRDKHTALALIESAEENAAALAQLNSSDAWIGLYRATGKWSDGSAVVFAMWYQLGGGQIYSEPYCAAQNEHNSCEVFSCQQRRPFYCQGEQKTKRTVKVKISGHGLVGSAMSQQISDEIRKRFGAAGHTDVKIKWKTVPEKQEDEKEQPLLCPLNV